jgi:hypothetical protein
MCAYVYVCLQAGATKRRVALSTMINKLRTGFAKRVQDPTPSEQRDYNTLMQQLELINAAGGAGLSTPTHDLINQQAFVTLT